MASTYSTNLALELIGSGDQAGSWGNTTNTNLGTLIEQAISGYVTQAVSTGTDTTITIPNGSTGVARNMYIELTGTGGTNTNLIVPANKKLYFIFNNSTGAVTVKVSGQTGVSVPAAAKMSLVCNGTDVVNAVTYFAALSSASLTLSGNLTLNGGTANGVLYLNGSKAATSGSALTFNGTNLINTAGYVSAATNFRLSNASFYRVADQSPGGFVGGYNIKSDGSTGAQYDSTGEVSGYGSYLGALTWYAGGSAAANTVAPERMRLDSSGNLGIGTSSPSYKLQVAGTAGTVGLGLTGTHAANDIGLYIAPSAITGAYEAIRAIPSASTGASYLFSNGNNSNTSAHARVEALTTSGNGGDPKFVLTISGVVNWSIGADNSVSDQFCISQSDAPGTTDRLTIDTNGSITVGAGSLATTATDGFLYVPTCAGTPTGTPTAKSGYAPIVVNTTNNKMYFYSGGQWRDAGP